MAFSPNDAISVEKSFLPKLQSSMAAPDIYCFLACIKHHFIFSFSQWRKFSVLEMQNVFFLFFQTH
jgi:hypothetical protein